MDNSRGFPSISGTDFGLSSSLVSLCVCKVKVRFSSILRRFAAFCSAYKRMITINNNFSFNSNR